MGARLYLHGDDDALATHMSIHLVLEQGEYDHILPWPFSFPVTFCLFDQSDRRGHIADTLQPNPLSRPTSSTSRSSGISKFCPLAIIQSDDSRYIRDNTMLIQVRVDFDSTPVELLPSLITLNPGLPHHVQEGRRRSEVDRLKQARLALDEQIHRDRQEVCDKALINSTLLLPGDKFDVK